MRISVGMKPQPIGFSALGSRWHHFFAEQLLSAGGAEAPSLGPADPPRLSPQQEKSLSKLLGGTGLSEWQDLARESDTELFFGGLLRLADRLEDSGRPCAAMALYQGLSDQREIPEIGKAAQRRLDAIEGKGALGPRAEFLLKRFARDATEPAGLLAMGAAGAVFQIGRTALLSRLLVSSEAGVLTRGLGARLAAGLFGFALEAPSFALVHRTMNAKLHPEDAAPSMSGEIASSFLFLGGMKLAGVGGEALAAGLRQPLPRQLLVQSTTLGGILLGHRLEEAVGLRPRVQGATLLVDSLATLLQFHVAGHISQAAFGEGFQRWQQGLQLRAEGNSSRPRDGGFFLGDGLVGAQVATVAPGIPTRDFEGLTQWSEGEMRGSGKSLVIATPTGLAARIQEEFPQLRRTMFPRTLKFVSEHPQLPAMIEAFREDLGKLERSLGGQEPPGAAPYVARHLAESLLQGKAPDFPLHEHPIAVLLAAALASHYQEHGDLIGHRIYGDLVTVYRLLREGEPNRYYRVEDIIHQNLELDPFNPWFLHLGLQTSLELGELSERRPSYFLDLRKDMEKLPEKWKSSVITRSIEKKLTDRSRKNYLGAAKEVGTTYAIVMGSLEFLGGLLSWAIPSPGHFLKGIFYLQRLGSKIKGTPEFFEEVKRRTSFEIQLYYGDYQSAVPYAEPGSKLPVIYEVLKRQQMGDGQEREIRLEAIPQLHPMAVRQTEALAELQRRLQTSRLVSLEGLPGSAKTYLAVQLAHTLQEESGHPVFWYTFKEGKKPNLQRFFTHLAQFLEQQDPANERGLGAKAQSLRPNGELLALVRSALTRIPSTLFIDNFHLVLEDTEARHAFTELFLNPYIESRAVTISRWSHDWHQRMGTQVFRKEAMTLEEAEDLFANLGLDKRLKPEQMQQAYVEVRGRPMSLMLLGELLRAAAPGQIPEILAGVEGRANRASVLKYLFDRVYAALSPAQRSLLQFLSVFREPVGKSALSFWGPGEEVQATKDLLSLQEAFLVDELQPEVFRVHEKYQKLAALQRYDQREFHRRAAEYYRAYAKFPSDYLEAAHHYVAAGEFDRAAKMLAGRGETLVKKGYARRLEILLQELDNHRSLSTGDRAAVWLELGNFHLGQGHWMEALEYHQKSLQFLQSRGDLLAEASLLEKMAVAYDALGLQKKSEEAREKAAAILKKQGS